MKINYRQIIVLSIWIIFVLALIILPKANAKLLGVIYASLFSLLFFRIYWSLGIPKDEGIDFKEYIQNKINNKFCPFCENRIGDFSIKVGYTKRFWNINHKIIYISYSFEHKEINTLIPICNNCKNKYLSVCERGLSLFARNPSSRVLKKKMGYWRGLRYPFEKWNIKLTEKPNE